MFERLSDFRVDSLRTEYLRITGGKSIKVRDFRDEHGTGGNHDRWRLS
jgi:hypothetical protein